MTLLFCFSHIMTSIHAVNYAMDGYQGEGRNAERDRVFCLLYTTWQDWQILESYQCVALVLVHNPLRDTVTRAKFQQQTSIPPTPTENSVALTVIMTCPSHLRQWWSFASQVKILSLINVFIYICIRAFVLTCKQCCVKHVAYYVFIIFISSSIMVWLLFNYTICYYGNSYKSELVIASLQMQTVFTTRAL